VLVEVAKLFEEQTMSRTVSATSTTSASEEVAVKVTVAPGIAGELSLKNVNEGRLFTLNGDALGAVPCFATELQRGFTATASQIHANHVLLSKNGDTSVVVVAAVEVAPLAVNAETAHRVAPAPQVGTAALFAVGTFPLLHTRR
jgi:hypothetical protein